MDIAPELVLAAVVALAAIGLYALYSVLAPRRETTDSTDTLTDDTTAPRGGIDRVVSDAVYRSNLNLTDEQAVGVMALTGAVLAAVMYAWQRSIGLAAAGLAVGVVLPLGVFLALRSRRRAKMQEQLPDALFAMARSLRAGLSLDESIATSAVQTGPPLADEFNTTARQIRLGLPVPTALKSMADRVQLTNFDAVAAAVAVATETGGQLPQLVERLAVVTREHNQYRRQFQAQTAQARTTALVIGLAGPALAITYLLWQPEVVRGFLQSSTGVTVFVVAGVLELIGLFALIRILRVDY